MKATQTIDWKPFSAKLKMQTGEDREVEDLTALGDMLKTDEGDEKDE